ncbi:amidohydrolase [mine drainage metagenome]|uniref:Amidohydrolase n=1 Tax=mine drainage metagenome TaxID=410659 RepID=A0A1J5SM98_9ZZZZ
MNSPDLPPSPNPVIDMHCHAAGIGAGASGCRVHPRLARNLRFGFYLRAFGVSRRDLADCGDCLVLDRIAEGVAASGSVNQAVVLALDGVVDSRGRTDFDRTEVLVPDDFVADGAARHPQLLFGASINPLRADALERLARAHSRGAVLVKWLPAIQEFDPADRRILPFLRRLAELGLPLLTHTGTEHSFTRARDEFSDPERLRPALREGVTVIAAHAASSGRYAGEPGLSRLARLAREFPTLYADISALTLVNRIGRLPSVLASRELEGRLLFGTDYPLVAMRPLVSPWPVAPRLGFRAAQAIARIPNPWDRDVALKQALGADRALFERAAQVLRLTQTLRLRPAVCVR